MTSDELKAFCKERGLTYAQLAEKIGMSEGGLTNAINQDKISPQASAAVKLVQENENLKEQLKKFENLKNALKDAIS